MKWTPFMLLCLPSCVTAQRLRASRGGTTTDSAAEKEESRQLPVMYDVCIVGAGFAGVGAAKSLQGRNIKVWEARDRIGGRSHTVALGSKTTELGCQWLMGVNPASPVYRAAQESGIQIIPTPVYLDEPTGVYTTLTGVFGLPSSGGPFNITNDVDGYIQMRNRLFGDFIRYQNTLRAKEKVDQSVRWVANKFIAEKGLTMDEKLILESLFDYFWEYEYAANLTDLSFKTYKDYGPEGKYAVMDQGFDTQGRVKGYSGVLQAYAAPFLEKIELNAQVTKIDYSGSSFVKVTYKKGPTSQTAQCRHVIVTVPLGVLQQQKITFVPVLPTKKSVSMNKLGMGVVNKVILYWDNAAARLLPWSGTIGLLQRIAPLGSQGNWTSFTDLRLYTDTNVLVAWVAGQLAQRAEDLSDTKVKAEVMESLRSMFVSNVPDPTEVIVTRWLQDSFALGSYSYYKVGSTPQDRLNLKESLKNRVHLLEKLQVSITMELHEALWKKELRQAKTS